MISASTRGEDVCYAPAVSEPDHRPPTRLRHAALLPVLLLGPLGACTPQKYDPSLAMPTFPETLSQPESIDVQVFRENTNIEIVNTSPRSYRDVIVWLNRRYGRRVDEIIAGETVRLSLWEFRDRLGEVFRAGGIFATEEPTPLRIVQIQLDDTQPMIGLITIRAEDAELR